MLRAIGIHPGALAAWAGSCHIPIVATRIAELVRLPVTQATAGLALLVAGADVPRRLLDPAVVTALMRHNVVTGGQWLRARVAIVPVGEAWVVCDRAEAAEDREGVLWPDDSSYHLIHSLPSRRLSSWLDLGCGSGFASLVRPNTAGAMLGSDLNPRAIAYARLGASLSNVAHAQFCHADLATGISGTFALITCNAPIPSSDGGPMWRVTTAEFFSRLFEHAARVLDSDGMLVVHGAVDALHPLVGNLPGERVIVTYTPREHPREFAVLWWRPNGRRRLATGRRELTVARPHLDHDDRLAALA